MNTLALSWVDLTSLSVPDRRLATVEGVHAARLRGASAVVLHTCERLEAYTSGASFQGICLGPASGTLTGVDAFRHLVRVATGLESRIPGEPHILGQVRAALNDAVEAGTVPLEVRRAFGAAIRCARFVRDRSALGAGERGYATRATEAVARTFTRVHDIHVVVVGSGAMARDVSRELAASGIGRVTVAGRHAPSVEAIAREAGATPVTLDGFLEGAVRCDAVVTAVSTRLPLLNPETLRAIGARLVVDLGAVPNVDLDASITSAVRILRLEDLATGDRTEAFRVAESLVEREVARHASASRSIQAGRERAPARRAS